MDAGWKPGLAGVHTYTRADGWEAIDGGYTADAEDSLFSPSEPPKSGHGRALDALTGWRAGEKVGDSGHCCVAVRI